VAASLGAGDAGEGTGFPTPASPPQERFHISISHDGDNAIAIAILAAH
jgi:holo-[acyl-carrier protein] synthase